MRSGKSSVAASNIQEDEDYEEDEFSAKKEGPSSLNTTSNSQNNSANTNKDSKNVDKANAIRSKHSVTEQRRRSKINERFQILRELIPHSDQKRDTASFLLEVINYLQLLQEKVQKYEGPFQGWNSEPTKLMPWRNSHWRVQSFVGQPQAMNNGSGPGPGSTLSGKMDDNNISMSPTMLATPHNLVESEASKVMDRQSEFANKGQLSMPLQANVPPGRSDAMSAQALHRPHSDAQSTDCTISDLIGHQEDLVIEGGTISISSAYSHGLLNSLTHALQSAGVDLSQANISVQIDLGNRANRDLTSETPVVKSHENPSTNHTSLVDTDCGEDQVSKRLKT